MQARDVGVVRSATASKHISRGLIQTQQVRQVSTIHNLHYYLSLTAALRAAIDEDRLSAFAAAFAVERARGARDASDVGLAP